MPLVTGPSQRPAANGAGLERRWEEALHRFASADAGRSAYVEGGGVRAGIAATTVRPGASVLKLFVAIAAHRAATAGALDLDETVDVESLPRSGAPSLLDSLRPEHRFTLGELVGLSLATSDNRIANHLVARIGFDRVNEAAGALGCTQTALRAGFDPAAIEQRGRASVTTALDCATALRAIAQDPVLRPLRPSLRSSLFNSRILSLLPDDVIVSHKTGTLAGVVNDVGVIHAPSGDMTVCFLCDAQPDRAQASADIGRCARAVFDVWEEQLP